MKKEEILLRSREAKSDEGILFAHERSLCLAFRLFCGVFAVLSLLALIILRICELCLLMTLWYVFFSAYVYLYRKHRGEAIGYLPMILAAAAIALLVSYIQMVF